MMSALIVGCFATDLEYFLGVHGEFGHTLPGVFVFDLPLAFAALWLFHHYAKEPLVAWLPEVTRERIEPAPRSLSVDSVSRFAMVIVSILVGIGTHILWDSFTHPWYYPSLGLPETDRSDSTVRSSTLVWDFRIRQFSSGAACDSAMVALLVSE